MQYILDILEQKELEKLNYSIIVRIKKINNDLIDEEDGINLFNVIKVKQYIHFLGNSLKQIGVGYNESMATTFGPDPGSEWDDISPVPANQVKLETYLGERIILLSEFYKLCLQLVEKSLEAVELYDLKGKGVVDDKWVKEMQEMTPKIKEVIRSL